MSKDFMCCLALLDYDNRGLRDLSGSVTGVSLMPSSFLPSHLDRNMTESIWRERLSPVHVETCRLDLSVRRGVHESGMTSPYDLMARSPF